MTTVISTAVPQAGRVYIKMPRLASTQVVKKTARTTINSPFEHPVLVMSWMTQQAVKREYRFFYGLQLKDESVLTLIGNFR